MGEVSSLDKRTKRHQGGWERLDVFTYKRGIKGMGQGRSVHKGTERHEWGFKRDDV